MSQPPAMPVSAPSDAVRLVDIINLSSSANTLLRERVLAMRESGVDNRILCIDGPYVKRLETLGIPIKTVAIPREVNPFAMVRATFAMASYLRRERIDVVHTHCSMPGILGRIAARLAGVPVIIHTIHGLHVHDNWRGGVRQLYTLAEKWCGGFTDMLLSQNRADLEIARHERFTPPERLRLIGNGIDLERFVPRPRPERRPLTLICTARFEPVKNHPMLFDVVKRLTDRGIDVRLLLVGEGALRGEYEALCAQLGIRERV